MLHDTFGNFSAAKINTNNLAFLPAEQRIEWAHDAYKGKLALTSSFGIQSVVMLELIDRANLNADIPLVTIDIPGAQYDAQRRYRETLARRYLLDLYVFPATDENDKSAALERGLKSLGLTTTLDGIRRDQTRTRSTKPFIEQKRKGLTAIHPLLDWSTDKVDDFIVNLNMHVMHPSWKPGVESKGGVILLAHQQKTECGLHGV